MNKRSTTRECSMLLRSSTVFLQHRKIEISTVRKGSPKLDLRRHIWRFNTLGYEDIKNYVNSKMWTAWTGNSGCWRAYGLTSVEPKTKHTRQIYWQKFHQLRFWMCIMVKDGGLHNFQNYRNHLKILDARRVIWSNSILRTHKYQVRWRRDASDFSTPG